jgi:hypothetical protein
MQSDFVTDREGMRKALYEAKDAIQHARDAGLNVMEFDRLLSEAVVWSYRLDFVSARNIADRTAWLATNALAKAVA